MVSPLCEVKEGAGAYGPTTNGIDATPAAAMTIRLIDSSADTWGISCITTDDLSVAATVTAALTIDPVLRTATFTAPAAGRAYRFQSVVNGGNGPNGRTLASYTTTFCVYTLVDGRRVIAADETTEGSTTFGWIETFNAIIRALPILAGEEIQTETGTGALANVDTTTALGDAGIVRFTGAAPTVSGFASGNSARKMMVRTTGGDLVLRNENAGSTAANRIVTGSGADVTIPNGGSAWLLYDSTSLRWSLAQDGGTGGGGGASVGGADAVQGSDGAGAFTDTGLTAAAGILYGGAAVPLATIDGSNRAVLGDGAVDFMRVTPAGGDGFMIVTGEYTARVGSGQEFIHQSGGTGTARIGPNVQIGPGATDPGGGVGVLGIDDAGTNPTTNPTAGIVIYSDGGAAKCRGSGGTVTTFGPADPHCPTCGRDFAIEHRNDTLGEHLAICVSCLIDTLQASGLDTSPFTIANRRGATKAEWDANHAAAKARDEAKRAAARAKKREVP